MRHCSDVIPIPVDGRPLSHLFAAAPPQTAMQSEPPRLHRLYSAAPSVDSGPCLPPAALANRLSPAHHVAMSDAFSLVPPLLAIVLAIVFRNVLVALFLAIWSGAVLLSDPGHDWATRTVLGLLHSIDTIIVGELADSSHLMIVLFTLFLGSLIGVMSGSGGTAALVERLTPLTSTRRGAQVTTWLLGLVIFFDDYANTLLLGSTMRPVTDRQRISREKLAFLVDATAAPVAGLAIVSTWVGFEVGLIGDAFRTLADSSGVALSTDAYGTFLATLPFRFYPVLLLCFVMMAAWTGRDFGPMLAAERRAWAATSASRRHTTSGTIPDSAEATGSLWNALVPLVVLLAFLVIGFVWTGWRGYYAAAEIDSASVPTVWQIVSNAESNRVLLVSSFLASVVAAVMTLLPRRPNALLDKPAVAPSRYSLNEAVDMWLEGAKSMLLGVCVLVLAWAVARVCDADHLNTAGFLVQQTTGYLSAAWMPTIAFLLAAVVSFATGSSWATMGLLIPLMIPMLFDLLVSAGIETNHAAHPLMLATIGSVLAGSIFGDHCSPISDTTVLSSIAADCDHLDHVATQLPYALCVAAVSVVCGTIPAGMGWGGWWLLPIGLVVTCGVVRVLGRRVERGV